jgi:hypothetical protein
MVGQLLRKQKLVCVLVWLVAVAGQRRLTEEK